MSDQNKSVKFNEIPLEENFLEHPFYVCTVQLRTPFWNETFIGSKDTKKYIGWNEVSLNERKQKIETVLNEIESKYIKKGINIKIIVLPEYSIENCIVPFLKTYSLKNGLMIIAGDYDQTERSNFAQIIYPHDGQSIAVKQFKLSTSKYDQAYLSELHKSKRNIYKFSWPSATSKREKNMITVYVCHDFLEHIFHTIDNKMAGLYIVIMCSPRVEEFYGLSCATIRAIKGYKSNVVLLCNAADNPPSKRTTSEVSACGETQIIGPSEVPLPKIGRFAEGGILAKIQLNALVSKPTRLGIANVIDNIISFAINEKGNIRESEDISSSAKIVINPNAVLQILGLQKIYARFCMETYSRMLDTFKYLPIAK